MVRLIACDIDGTLLHGEQTRIPSAVLEQIGRLEDRGILFCAASGRQYGNMRGLFSPAAGRMYFLCENGSAIFGPGRPGPLLRKVPIPRERALALSREIVAIPGCEVMISGENTSYLCPKEPYILPHVRDFVGNTVALVEEPGQVPEDIIKISAFCRDGAVDRAAGLLAGWGGELNMAVAGALWLDFTPSNKGEGLAHLCRLLEIPLEQVMAFGDNYNDLPMLERVGRPYIMDNAARDLRRRFPNHCARVEDVLEKL